MFECVHKKANAAIKIQALTLRVLRRNSSFGCADRSILPSLRFSPLVVLLYGTGNLAQRLGVNNCGLKFSEYWDQRFRNNAKKLQQAIRSRDPISMAAELIESALRIRRA
jgi:hypothetical protein